MDSRILQICDAALEVAEKSAKQQQDVICALVELAHLVQVSDNNTKRDNKELSENKELARRYIKLLRDGHKLPINKIIGILEMLSHE
jgi:hypothetical protein